MKKCLYLVLVLVLICSIAQAQTAEERLQRLEKICQEQEAQIQQLQGRLGVLQNETSYKEYTESIIAEYLQSPAMEDERIAITAGYDQGFFVRDAEGAVELKVTGYVQAGLSIYENNSPNDNSFFLRAGVLTFDIYMLKDWHARLEIDFANNDQIGAGPDNRADDPELTDAYIEYIGIPEFSVRVGNFHIPFSVEGQYSSADRMTILQSPFIHSWAHGRDVGVMIYGVLANMIGYSAGLFNSDISLGSNVDDEFLAAGQLRLFYCGYDTNPDNFIHVGIMANRADENLWIDQARLGGYFNNIHAINDVVGGNQRSDDWKLGIDVGITYNAYFDGGHSLRFEVEGMAVRWDRRNVRGNVVGYGLAAGVTYKHCLTPDIADSGLLAGFHYSYNDIDNHGGPNFDKPMGTEAHTAYIYTVILGYAFNSHVDIAFNWIIMDLDEKVGAKVAKSGGLRSGSLEQAWMFQVTAKF